MSIVLAIESSCDETSASICIDGKIINNIISTQEIHRKYGGVVPELASRSHQKNIVPIIDHVIEDAKIKITDINAVAYTQGPGLLGALLVANSFAKSIAASLNIPLIPVHHMKAHILAHFIEEPKPEFPFLCLTISGGHTQIVKVSSPLEMEVLGQTIDDAVGEAFDKAAKIIGLPYPGGPEIDKLAKNGDPLRFKYAEYEVDDLNYSFSGIKTSFLYAIQKEMKKDSNFIHNNMNDIAASIQHNLIEMLMKKLVLASKLLKINKIAIAGGVAANSALRKKLKSIALEKNWEVFIPDFQYCTDNAGMVAMTGYLMYENGYEGTLKDIPMPRMPF